MSDPNKCLKHPTTAKEHCLDQDLDPFCPISVQIRRWARTDKELVACALAKAESSRDARVMCVCVASVVVCQAERRAGFD